MHAPHSRTSGHRRWIRDARVGGTPAHPLNAEKRYRRTLVGYVRVLEEVAEKELLPHLSLIVGREDSLRMDANRVLLGSVLRSVLMAWGEVLSDEQRASDVDAMLSETDRFSTRQVKRVLEVDFITSSKAKKVFDRALRENIRLIRSVAEESLFGAPGGRKGVKHVIEQGIAEGRLTSDITKEIEQRFAVARSRAELIARDQVGSVNAAMTSEKFTNAGIIEFIWTTGNDNRVREEHEAINNESFAYAAGGHPTEGLPGEPIQCRCVQTPVIPDV